MSRTVVDLVAGSGLPFVTRGAHPLASGSWELFAVGNRQVVPGRTPLVARGDEEHAVFRREGQYWTIDYDGTIVHMRDTLGMHYLARLLTCPQREIHVLDLLAGESGSATRTVASDDGLRVNHDDAGAILDETAKAAYRARIEDLREEIAEADRWDDAERSARAQYEFDALVQQLAAAVGLGGRDRRAIAASERARFSVSKALKTALRRIGQEHPDLGQHLAATVRSGTFCVYAPDTRSAITWNR